MSSRHLTVIATVLAALALAACGGGDGRDTLTLGERDIVPVPGNSELVVGPNRFALGLLDKENQPVLAEPGTAVHLRFFYGEELKTELDADFTWAIPDVNGFFVADVDFDQAGQWTAEALLTRDGEETTVTFTFPVREQSEIPNVGDAAPPTENLTLAQEPNIRRLSTDRDPDPALYELTVAEALDAGRPFVVVFATPAFCQTRFCGPVVDNVKEVRAQFADSVTFIHIEPFELDEDGQLVTNEQGAPIPAGPTTEWRLLTEPWIFIVGADGRIAARFEGAASPDELREALRPVVG